MVHAPCSRVGSGQLTKDPLRVIVFTRYDRRGASSRQRILQFLPHLARNGVHCEVAPLLSDRYLQRLYEGAGVPVKDVADGYLRRARLTRTAGAYDVVWVQQDFFPWLPFPLESLLISSIPPYVLDIDDAFFHRYDTHPHRFIRRLLGTKLDRAMARAALVTAGNDYLAERARASGSARVELVPTVVDVDAYARAAAPPSSAAPFTIGWIGSPTTAVYLHSIAAALRRVQQANGARIRVIGAPPEFALDGVRLDVVPWTEETEIAEISRCTVGIMPLLDTPWERGKCGFKLIQYMAAGLPVVGSPVGANREIIEQGVNGFHAGSEAEWVDALTALGADAALRTRLGAAGRSKVEAQYSLVRTAPRIEGLLRAAAGAGKRAGASPRVPR